MNKISWRRWQDPLAPLLNQVDEDDPYGIMSENEFEDKHGPIGPCVIGPAGVIPLHESTLPSKLYNLWMGETNFDLTRELIARLVLVEGVESLDVFTRYRFRLAVGRLFDEQAVKLNIEKISCEKKEPVKNIQGGLSALQANLAKKFLFWGICVMQDGKTKPFGGDTQEEVKSKMQPFEQAAKRVVLSWR